MSVCVYILHTHFILTQWGKKKSKHKTAHQNKTTYVNLPLHIIISASQPLKIELGIVTTQGTTLNTQP